MKILTIAFGAAALAVPAMASAATYLPTGPQLNVALSTVTGGGWTLCHQSTMAESFGNSAANTLAGCGGNRLLLAGRETGSSNLLALAQTTKVNALANTGASNNGVFTSSDGSDWFNADGWSWGFKPIGEAMDKFQCDFSPPVNGSVCIHTIAGVGGFSINGITGFSGNYERLVFTDLGAAVPEPSTWAMIVLGFGALGGAMRRRKVAVSYA